MNARGWGGGPGTEVREGAGSYRRWKTGAEKFGDIVWSARPETQRVSVGPEP